MKIEKQLVFKGTLEICVYVHQFTTEIKKISNTLKYPISLRKLSQAIRILDLKNICVGGPRSIDFPGKHYSLIFLILPLKCNRKLIDYLLII